MSSKFTREQWLNTALHKHIAPFLAQHGAIVPADCRVSIGFPGGGSARKRIGECWPRARSKNGVNEIFINPVLDDRSRLLDILVHEAIHAADDCKSGHKGFFRRVAVAIGLTGKMTATVAGPELQARIGRWIVALPDLTHGALDISQRKKQGTRMLLVLCPGCGCKARMTRQWLDAVGAPTCGCGTPMGCVE